MNSTSQRVARSCEQADASSGTELRDILPDHPIDRGLVRDGVGFLGLHFPEEPVLPLFRSFGLPLGSHHVLHPRGTFREHNRRIVHANAGAEGEKGLRKQTRDRAGARGAAKWEGEGRNGGPSTSSTL